MNYMRASPGVIHAYQGGKENDGVAFGNNASVGALDTPRSANNTAAPSVDRDRLSNDILNTAVMAALVGGFALSSVQLEGSKTDRSALDTLIYIFALLGVHANTCSALCSAFLYRYTNGLPAAALDQWASSHSMLLTIPMMKFTGGTVCYLISVIMLAYRDLLEQLPVQILALFIGLSSVCMVFATYTYIECTSPSISFAQDEDSTEPSGTAHVHENVAAMPELRMGSS